MFLVAELGKLTGLAIIGVVMDILDLVMVQILKIPKNCSSVFTTKSFSIRYGILFTGNNSNRKGQSYGNNW